jgi:hypothetical protein
VKFIFLLLALLTYKNISILFFNHVQRIPLIAPSFLIMSPIHSFIWDCFCRSLSPFFRFHMHCKPFFQIFTQVCHLKVFIFSRFHANSLPACTIHCCYHICFWCSYLLTLFCYFMHCRNFRWCPCNCFQGYVTVVIHLSSLLNFVQPFLLHTDSDAV